MHEESYKIMKKFVNKYLDKNTKLRILDVGSYNINGTYKDLFNNPNWKYIGLDIEEGPNVDIVAKELYDFDLKNESFDVVISGNCLEHVEAPWIWIKEIEKIVKKKGLICIIVPFNIPVHKCPIDCWRILPDGYKYLLEKYCDFKILECDLNKPPSKFIYHVFSRRPYLFWILKLLPNKIKKVFEIEIKSIQDTYAIAKKI